jgi:hypothetical protein
MKINDEKTCFNCNYLTVCFIFKKVTATNFFNTTDHNFKDKFSFFYKVLGNICQFFKGDLE